MFAAMADVRSRRLHRSRRLSGMYAHAQSYAPALSALQKTAAHSAAVYSFVELLISSHACLPVSWDISGCVHSLGKLVVISPRCDFFHGEIVDHVCEFRIFLFTHSSGKLVVISPRCDFFYGEVDHVCEFRIF